MQEKVDMAYMEAVGDDEQVSKDTFVSDTPRIIPTVKIFGKRMRRCALPTHTLLQGA